MESVIHMDLSRRVSSIWGMSTNVPSPYFCKEGRGGLVVEVEGGAKSLNCDIPSRSNHNLQ